MALKDPEGFEKKFLHKLVDFSGKRVLEIGCGEGRLTWQYATASRLTVGIDPDRTALLIARADTPEDLRPIAKFCTADASRLAFSSASFDIALFAWSL